MNNPSPVITELNRLIEKHGSQAAVARVLGVSESYISEILGGTRGLSTAMLRKLGYVKIVIHVKPEQKKRVERAIEQAVS